MIIDYLELTKRLTQVLFKILNEYETKEKDLLSGCLTLLELVTLKDYQDQMLQEDESLEVDAEKYAKSYQNAQNMDNYLVDNLKELDQMGCFTAIA